MPEPAQSLEVWIQTVGSFIRRTLDVEWGGEIDSKWFGAAFAQLPCAAELEPHLCNALAADTWQIREQHLGAIDQISNNVDILCDARLCNRLRALFG